MGDAPDVGQLGAAAAVASALLAVPANRPEVSITLTQALNAGIAAQLRALADLLDPPKGN